MPDIQIYGVKPSMAALSAVFLGGGLICFGALMRYPITGDPFIVHLRGQAPRAANGVELGLISLLPLVFVVLGGVGLIAFQNQKIYIEPQGLSSIDILGRKGFSARWDQLTRLRRRFSRGGHYFVLEAGAKSMTISSGMERVDEIAEAIMVRAPQLREPDSG